MKHVNLFWLILFLTNPVFSQYDMGHLPGFGTPQPSLSPPTYANIPESKHVLVVYASNIPVSQQIKNAYVAARSIPATNEYGINIPPNGQGAFLAQNGEEIRGNGNAGWLYYTTNIAAYIENHLSTTYNSEGQLLKDVIRYIVFCKGIPHKVRSVPYIWNSLVRKNVSTDALACMLFQNVLSLYDTPYYFVVNPLFKADTNITLDYRFVPNHFVNAQGWRLSYLVSRLDGDDFADVDAMIQRSLQPDVTGEKWRILDDGPCVGFSGVSSYMQQAHNKLSNLGFANMNPTPYVNDLSWITNNPSGQVIGYSSFGNNAGSRDNLPPLCVPGLPRMPEDYILNTLNFQYANGAIFHTWESYNGWTFSHYRLDDVGGRVAQGLIEDFVHRGGTGGEFHTYEPRVNGMGHDDVHHPAYAMGYTLVDAIYQGIQYLAWQSGVVGDPLVAIAHGKQTMTQSQIWSGANLITGKVTVPAGKTLTVTAGATLKFMPNAELFVEGQLLVNGTASQPVIVEVKGHPVFGDMDNRQPGINTLANNQNFQMIVLQDSKVYSHENFYREPDPIPSLDFSVDASSLLFYEPYQSSDPNGCGSGASTIGYRAELKKILATPSDFFARSPAPAGGEASPAR